jgi:transcriptional regulator GlxA family with amidase domain
VARAWTSAGVNTGIELALALVEGGLGHDVAIDIARTLALPMLRGGELPQLSPTLQARPTAAGMARVPLASGLKPLKQLDHTLCDIAAS